MGLIDEPLKPLFRKSSHAPFGRILRKSASPVKHTGETCEVVLATITLPANAMGKNGRIVVEGRVSYSNNSRAKIVKVKFGDVTYLQGSLTSSKWWRFELKVRNKGGADVQEGSGFGLLSTGALVGVSNNANSSRVDTGQKVDVTITGELENPVDTITLETYQVIVHPK